MYLLGVKKVQICPFKGTAPATSCCTPKGTILNPYFSVYMRHWMKQYPESPALKDFTCSLTSMLEWELTINPGLPA